MAEIGFLFVMFGVRMLACKLLFKESRGYEVLLDVAEVHDESSQ